MIKIDWRMAPDWADGHGLISWQGFTEVWINADQYAVVGREGGPYPWGGGTSDTRHNHARGQVEYITPRLDRWSGEGKPPVGTVCEYLGAHQYDQWSKVTIFAEWKDLVFVDFGDGWRQERDVSRFRPIRTPEQIAADDRLHEIRNALTTINSKVHFPNDLVRGNILAAAVEAMIDAGYRKQEAS